MGADRQAVKEARLARELRGIGWGGQRLYVYHDLDFVVAINCGNYGKSGIEQTRVTNAVLTEAVLPAFVQGQN